MEYHKVGPQNVGESIVWDGFLCIPMPYKLHNLKVKFSQINNLF